MRLETIAVSNLVGYIPTRVLARVRAGLRLKELPVPELKWRRPVGVIYRDGGYVSPAARRFIEILRTASKALTAAGRS
jgi:DNA-binding transcriptional LysR family regulator